MVTLIDSLALGRIHRLIADPIGTIKRRFKPIPDVERINLDLLRSIGSLARRAGFDDLYLFLSFDCDTDEDIQASLEIHKFLSGLGIKMTMAVPGVQLQNGASAYGSLAAQGVEFMNHGFLPHAAWSEDRYVSTTFYGDMSTDEVEADIREGHAAVANVLGRPSVGFRAPHFGMFKEPEQLALIYRVVRELGYRYCSTTIPSVGHAKGPAFDVGGLFELPAFGSAAAPTTILDSWTYLTNRQHYTLGDSYCELMTETVDTLREHHIPALLTWYADPSHVVGQTSFRRAMEHIANSNIPSLSGLECAEVAGVHLR